MKLLTSTESLMRDTELLDEINTLVGTDAGALPKSESFRIQPKTIRAAIDKTSPASERIANRAITEAIIRNFGRPSLLIKNNTFEIPAADTWKARLQPNQSKLERAIRSVGRIELLLHPTYEWIGTGWMIAENIAITNRHVALEFARASGSGRSKRFLFARNPDGQTIQARLDFREEHEQLSPALEVRVEKIIFVEELTDRAPDLALVQLKANFALPPPIPLSSAALRPQQNVAVIGYPAYDDRNAPSAMAQIFGDIFEVKRLAPGQVMNVSDGANRNVFTHDCSTLGGNSGSALIDIETGNAVGLHFGGQFHAANYAVRADVLRDTLKRLKISVAIPATTTTKPKPSTGTTKPGAYADREGYQLDFLGSSNAHQVPLPTVHSSLKEDVAPLKGSPQEFELKYAHFSLVMSKSRRQAFFTAVNIDGGNLRHIPREGDKWSFDPRLSEQHQVGDELYKSNDLDRGHLVRRLDPVWGTDAAVANEDTFHFTNASPQHKDLNQRTWNDLEEYILDNAGAHDLRVCVFTGPVFRDNDKIYRNFKIPQQFWKVVAIVKTGATASARKLSATAYILSQSHLLSHIEAAGFAFGAFRTYQVPVTQIEELTKLDFGPLRRFDPLKPEERKRQMESIRKGEAINRRGEALRPLEGFGYRQLDSLDDIVF